MGFKKTKAFEEIRVPMVVKMADETSLDAAGNATIVETTVAHIFRIPPPSVREEWQRLLVRVKGKNVSSGSKPSANWFLWKHCILRVEGYDDLPPGDLWKEYFSDAIGRIHVDNVVDMLMETLGSEEAEQEKKFEESSEP